MPQYRYSARDRSGSAVHGTVNAVSIQAAREALREMNLEAEELMEVSSPSPSPSAFPAATQPAMPRKTPPMTFERSPSPFSPPVHAPAPPPASATARAYFPLKDTLRLYCGWLLAWYFLIFAFGSYGFLRALPFDIPLVSSLFLSPVLVSFALGAYLFLLLTDLHHLLRGRMGIGILLTLMGFGLFVLFRMNM